MGLPNFKGLGLFARPVKKETPSDPAERVTQKRARQLVVTVGCSKGGGGKTTLNINIGVGYALQGKKVLILDADEKQLSALKWPRKPSRGYPHVEKCKRLGVPKRITSALLEGYDVVLVDLGGRDDPAAINIIAASDIVLIPSKPTYLDLQEVRAFRRMADAKRKPHFVIFNEATRENTKDMSQLREIFRAEGPFFPFAVRHLKIFRQAYPYGVGVLESKNQEHPGVLHFQRFFVGLDAAINDAQRSKYS